jgi:hypothetical protein
VKSVLVRNMPSLLCRHAERLKHIRNGDRLILSELSVRKRLMPSKPPMPNASASVKKRRSPEYLQDSSSEPDKDLTVHTIDISFKDIYLKSVLHLLLVPILILS